MNTRGRLRIGVNLLWCLPGAVGGSEQYLVRQLAGLMQLDAVDLTVFATHDFAIAHGATLAGAALVIAPHDGHRRSRRVIDENTWLWRRTGGFDLVHHGGGTAPRRSRRPYLLTVHDLQYRTFPQYFSVVKRRYLDAIIPGSARRAALITVPSDYVRSSIATELGVATNRIVVVPHGYEPQLLVERTAESELRARLGLADGRVLVYPAMTAPHKRHAFLVELMQRHWIDDDLRLVLIGGRGSADDALGQAIASAPPSVRNRIVRAGRVSDADRNGLLAMARAMVFPSEYEGFGAPLIEAMALGTPIVCSDATCLPDIAGDAAIVRPLRLEAWADALHDVEVQREQLMAAGHRQVEHFTTAVSGQALLGAYHRAAAA